jgi:hypothetical protein
MVSNSTTLAVILAFNPDNDRGSKLHPSGPSLTVEDIFLQQKKSFIAALSPAAPTRPIERSKP